MAHQHQRERKQVMVGGKVVTYIEATKADIAAVDRLCASVLGTTADELSPATRKLLDALGASWRPGPSRASHAVSYGTRPALGTPS
jgi:hypothetical protein